MSQPDIRRLLQCPACFLIMVAPIYICSAGHSICNKCKVKIRYCPTCRGLLNPRRRNFSLEHLSSVILHPCPHEENGCPEQKKYEDLNNHAKICCFRVYDCVVEECNFQGPRGEMKKHVEEDHVGISWMRAQSTNMWCHTKPKCETLVALCYDQMFYFHRHLVNNTMYWTCQFVGKSEDAPNFTFKITIDAFGRKYSYSDRCQPDILTVKEVFKSGHCLAMPVTVLATYQNEEKSILYYVDIGRTYDQNK